MSHNCSEAVEDEIKVCAYFIWEQECKPVLRALDHWLQGELQSAASLWHDSLLYQKGERKALKTGGKCRGVRINDPTR